VLNSPDLSPCDFWLFNLIKRNLSDQDDFQSLHEAVNKFMNSLKKEEYKKSFDKMDRTNAVMCKQPA
jgi:hypothetical protein